MSIQSIPIIMRRIKAARARSPIAVFRTAEGLDAVFANTLHTKSRILADDRKLIGVFDFQDNSRTIRERLRKVIGA